MTLTKRACCLLACLVLPLAVAGCKKARIAQEPDYTRALPPGAHALRKITDPAQFPDLGTAFAGRDAGLTTALDRSLSWYVKPTTRQFFPLNDIDHEHAHASVFAFRQLLATPATTDQFRQQVYENFDPYISVGWDDRGTVLYTGYYSPIFHASRVRTGQYQHPLYKRPGDLVADPVTGETRGRNVHGTIVTYPARAEIERSNMLAGTELVWLPGKLDAYIIQVNGSAQLTMTDGSSMLVGYAGNNGHQYTGVGPLLVADGKLDKNRVSLPAIRAYFQAHPEDLDRYIQRNERFVFFQEYQGDIWPAGALGVKVTPNRTLATDKKIFPRGSVTLVQTKVPEAGGVGLSMAEGRRLDEFMLDQDAGGAIRAPGRADIYMGIGEQAEGLAGRQFAEGRLYYFFLKPERVAQWRDRARGAGPMTMAR